MKPGPKPDPIREAWRLRFGITEKAARRLGLTRMCWQLCLCRDDCARRLLLGVSE